MSINVFLVNQERCYCWIKFLTIDRWKIHLKKKRENNSISKQIFLLIYFTMPIFGMVCTFLLLLARTFIVVFKVHNNCYLFVSGGWRFNGCQYWQCCPGRPAFPAVPPTFVSQTWERKCPAPETTQEDSEEKICSPGLTTIGPLSLKPLSSKWSKPWPGAQWSLNSS